MNGIIMVFVFSALAAHYGGHDIEGAIYSAAAGVMIAINYKKP